MKCLRLCASLLLLVSSAAGQGDAVRVTTEVSARRVYVGERVTLVYNLTREVTAEGLVPPVRDVRLVEAPRFADFWVNEIETEDANRPNESITNLPLRRFRLFPLVGGKLRIEPPAYTMLTYATSIDGLTDPMPPTVTRRAEVVTVEVVPLPTAGRPETFGGAVGRFALAASFEEPDGRAGEVTRVRVEVQGDGNLEATGPPRFGPIDGARVFAAQRVSVNLGLDSPTGVGRARWTVDVIPERAGTLALGPALLDTFDPAAGRYVTVRTEPLSIAVAAARAAPSTSEPVARRSGTSVWLVAILVAIALLAAVALVARFGLRARRPRAAVETRGPLPADLARLRERVTESLASAEQARAHGDARALYAYLLEGIGDLMASLHGVAPSELSRERIERELRGARVPPAVVDRVAKLYDHCLEAGYSPTPPAANREPIQAATKLFDALLRART